MPDDADNPALPLYAEELRVDRRRVETARVRVSTRMVERPTQVDETLTHERVEVARVPVGRVVTEMPPVREEGGVTIIPVIEEILVIERRLVLKEEVHLKRVRVTEHHRETVMLREQQATVERTESQVEPLRERRVEASPNNGEKP